MPDRKLKTCKSAALKKKKQYFVQKCKSSNPNFEWEFKAFLKKGLCNRKTKLSTLHGGRVHHEDREHPKGFCWATEELSPAPVQGCGLATAMMELCFNDADIGSIDPKKNSIFKTEILRNGVLVEYLRKWKEMAILNCEHIVYTSCNPQGGNPVIGCAAYMTAALNTGHKMMFTFPTGLQHPTGRGYMDVLNVQYEAKKSLQGNGEDGAKRFKDTYGYQWFFCRCKDERKEECMNM